MEISVRSVGNESRARTVASDVDDGIENDYNPALVSRHLDRISVHYKSKNAVLTLTGSLKNAQVRKEAEQLASKVPNVRQVVNQLEVRP